MSQEDTREFVGGLNITVVKGTNLAVRDMLTSDPYVVLALGAQIGRWFMTKDNALLKDSTVNVVGGKVKQEVQLKLQNVESGELELELEWVPL
nr:unnamed protein product [Digitaria exilis]